MHWSEARQAVVLEVTPCSLDQLDSATGTPLTSYMFRDIEALVPVSDIPGGLCIQVRLSINWNVYVHFFDTPISIYFNFCILRKKYHLLFGRRKDKQ